MSELWPNITEKIDQLPDADKFNPKLNPEVGDKTDDLSEEPDKG